MLNEDWALDSKLLWHCYHPEQPGASSRETAILAVEHDQTNQQSQAVGCLGFAACSMS